MADPVAIEQFFVSEFIAQGGFGMPIIHENEGPASNVATPYCEVKAFPNAEEPETLVSQNMTSGVYQFALYYDPAVGGMQGKLKRQEIFNHFRTRKRFVHDGISIDITQNLPFIAERQGDRFVVIGRILYEASYRT